MHKARTRSQPPPSSQAPLSKIGCCRRRKADGMPTSFDNRPEPAFPAFSSGVQTRRPFAPLHSNEPQSKKPKQEDLMAADRMPLAARAANRARSASSHITQRRSAWETGAVGSPAAGFRQHIESGAAAASGRWGDCMVSDTRPKTPRSPVRSGADIFGNALTSLAEECTTLSDAPSQKEALFGSFTRPSTPAKSSGMFGRVANATGLGRVSEEPAAAAPANESVFQRWGLTAKNTEPTLQALPPSSPRYAVSPVRNVTERGSLLAGRTGRRQCVSPIRGNMFGNNSPVRKPEMFSLASTPPKASETSIFGRKPETGSLASTPRGNMFGNNSDMLRQTVQNSPWKQPTPVDSSGDTNSVFARWGLKANNNNTSAVRSRSGTPSKSAATGMFGEAPIGAKPADSGMFGWAGLEENTVTTRPKPSEGRGFAGQRNPTPSSTPSKPADNSVFARWGLTAKAAENTAKYSSTPNLSSTPANPFSSTPAKLTESIFSRSGSQPTLSSTPAKPSETSMFSRPGSRTEAMAARSLTPSSAFRRPNAPAFQQPEQGMLSSAPAQPSETAFQRPGARPAPKAQSRLGARTAAFGGAKPAEPTSRLGARTAAFGGAKPAEATSRLGARTAAFGGAKPAETSAFASPFSDARKKPNAGSFGFADAPAKASDTSGAFAAPLSNKFELARTPPRETNLFSNPGGNKFELARSPLQQKQTNIFSDTGPKKFELPRTPQSKMFALSERKFELARTPPRDTTNIFSRPSEKKFDLARTPPQDRSMFGRPAPGKENSASSFNLSAAPRIGSGFKRGVAPAWGSTPAKTPASEPKKSSLATLFGSIGSRIGLTSSATETPKTIKEEPSKTPVNHVVSRVAFQSPVQSTATARVPFTSSTAFSSAARDTFAPTARVPFTSSTAFTSTARDPFTSSSARAPAIGPYTRPAALRNPFRRDDQKTTHTATIHGPQGAAPEYFEGSRLCGTAEMRLKRLGASQTELNPAPVSAPQPKGRLERLEQRLVEFIESNTVQLSPGKNYSPLKSSARKGGVRKRLTFGGFRTSARTPARIQKKDRMKLSKHSLLKFLHGNYSQNSDMILVRWMEEQKHLASGNDYLFDRLPTDRLRQRARDLSSKLNVNSTLFSPPSFKYGEAAAHVLSPEGGCGPTDLEDEYAGDWSLGHDPRVMNVLSNASESTLRELEQMLDMDQQKQKSLFRAQPGQRVGRPLRY